MLRMGISCWRRTTKTLRPIRRSLSDNLVLACVLLFASVVLHPVVAACDGDLVLVISDTDETQYAFKIRAELEAIGFEVDLVDESSLPQGTDRMVSFSRSRGAVAAILLAPSNNRVEIIVRDPSGSGEDYKTVEVSTSDKMTDSTFWLSAVEVLRASLIQSKPVSPPQPVEGLAVESSVAKSGNRQDEQEKNKSRRFIDLELGPAVVAASFKASPMMNIQLGLAAHITDLVGLYVVGWMPLVPSSVERAQGEAKTQFGLAGGGLRLTFAKPDDLLRPSVDAGFAAVFLKVRGRATTGYTDNEELVATGGPLLRGGLSVQLMERIRLRIDVNLGFAIVETVVRISGQSVATYGQPFLAGALNLEIYLW
jgi:hypothetical protein